MDSRLSIEPRGCVLLCVAEFDRLIASMIAAGATRTDELVLRLQTMRTHVIKQAGQTVPALTP